MMTDQDHHNQAASSGRDKAPSVQPESEHQKGEAITAEEWQNLTDAEQAEYEKLEWASTVIDTPDFIAN